MKRIRQLISFLLIIFLMLGCSSAAIGEEDPPETVLISVPEATEEVSREDRFPAAGVLFQWAVGAEASSEFSNPEWSAAQALGIPDSPGCGDYQFAWASAASDSIDTLVLDYPVLVYPLEIVVYESFNPDQVVKVEVLDPDTGGFYTVLQKNPIQVDRSCPYELAIPVMGINFKTNTVRITLDQSQLGLGWNEIDAVELIGSVNPP
ncbi:MAG: hypothetical protein ACC633_01685 [Anaerolineales bacterium]